MMPCSQLVLPRPLLLPSVFPSTLETGFQHMGFGQGNSYSLAGSLQWLVYKIT